MSSPETAVHDSVAELLSRVRSLEERLNLVERRLAIEPQAASAPAPEVAFAPAALEEGEPVSPAGVMTLVGKTLLGLAVAYLLRAFTENQTLPVGLGVALGLLYALGWLVWAARTPAEETLTIGLRTLTSILVLMPLLWEATVRFGALSSWATGALIALFGVFGLAISWRKNLTLVAWLTSLGGLIAAIGLIAKTHDLVPYTAALLILAAAVEASACLEHYLGERWVVAFTANIAVLFMTFIATRPPGALETYPAIGANIALALLVALPAIYLASTIIRTLGRARAISSFEILQCVAAFLIAAWGSIQVSHGHPAAILSVGLFCAIAGAACYLVSFRSLERQADRLRNFHVYALFGLVLALAAIQLLAAGTIQSAVLAALAVLFALAGMNSGRVTLKLHAAAYLVFGSIAAGLAGAANARFLSTDGHAGQPLTVAMWVIAVAGVAAYAVILRTRPPEEDAEPYLGVSTVIGASAIWGTAGILAGVLAPICARSGTATAGQDYCSTALTGVLVLFSLASAYGARRLARRELTWLSVGLAALAGYKLIAQDLHEATAFGVVLSLLAYGATLSTLPRLIRWTRANLRGAAAR